MDQIALYEAFLSAGLTKEAAKSETQRITGASKAKDLSKLSETEQVVYKSLVSLGGSAKRGAIHANCDESTNCSFGGQPSYSTVKYNLDNLRRKGFVRLDGGERYVAL